MRRTSSVRPKTLPISTTKSLSEMRLPPAMLTTSPRSGLEVSAASKLAGTSVLDEAKVARLLAVAENGDRLAGKRSLNETRDGRRVGAVGALPRTEDVEITKAQGFDAIERGKDLEVLLAGELGHRVGGHRRGRHVFALGKGGRLAVSRRGRRENEPLYARSARLIEHRDGTVDVDVVAFDWSFDASRYGAQGGFVENDLDPLDGSGDNRRVANVAGDGLDARRVAAGHPLDRALEERPVPGDEVVEHPYDSPRAASSATRLDPMKPAPPVTRNLGFANSAEPLAATNFFHDPRVFDFPGAGPLFDVLQLSSNLALDLFVDGHVLFERGGHLATENDVFEKISSTLAECMRISRI